MGCARQSATPHPVGTLATTVQTSGVTPSPATSPTPLVVEGTISILHAWDETQRAPLLGSIAEFQKQYPNVRFDVKYVPSLDLKASFEAAVEEGYSPGILIAPAEWGPELYKVQRIVSLSALVSPDLLKTLAAPALGASQYQGEVLGLPLTLKGIVLYRNPTIVPVSPATFEDLVILAKDATKEEKVGAYLDRGFFYSGAHLYGLGGRLITPDGQPAFNEDGYRKLLSWIGLLKYFEKAGPTDFNTERDIEWFKQGRAGLIIDGTWRMAELRDVLGPNALAIDPWPTYLQGKLSGFVQAENVYLTPQALKDEPDISWMFVQTLFSQESQLAIAKAGMLPPTNNINSQVNIEDPLLAQAMTALAGGIVYPIHPEMTAYTPLLDTALRNVLEKHADAQAAFEGAYLAIQSALAGGTPTPTPTPTTAP